MANKAIEKIQKDAEALYNLKETIKAEKEVHKTKMDALETEKEACEAIILASMKNVGLTSLKVANGDTVAIKTSKGVEIISPVFALKWATENKAVTIDKRIVGQLMKNMKVPPPGFQLSTRDYIKVTPVKAEKEIEE